MADRFQALDPIRIRKTEAGEVFTFIRRYGEYIQREKRKNGEIIEKNGKRILRRQARDDWF